MTPRPLDHATLKQLAARGTTYAFDGVVLSMRPVMQYGPVGSIAVYYSVIAFAFVESDPAAGWAVRSYTGWAVCFERVALTSAELLGEVEAEGPALVEHLPEAQRALDALRDALIYSQMDMAIRNDADTVGAVCELLRDRCDANGPPTFEGVRVRLGVVPVQRTLVWRS